MDKKGEKMSKKGVVLIKKDAKVTKKEGIMSQNETKVEENGKNNVASTKKTAKKANSYTKLAKSRAKSTKNTSKKGGKTMTDREKAEAILRKVAKQFKLEVNRVNAKKNATSDKGPLQVRKDGRVKLAVKTHDILVFSPQSYLKLGKVGPKHFEYLTVFKFGTDPKILEKAFTKGLKDKKTGEQWAIEMKCRSYKRTPVNLKARKEKLEAELKAIKTQLRKASKPKQKKVVKGAITKVAAKTTA